MNNELNEKENYEKINKGLEDLIKKSEDNSNTFPNFPNIFEETPNITEEDSNIPTESPSITEDNSAVPTETPIITEEDSNIPTESPSITEDNSAVPTETPIVTEENSNITTESPNITEDNSTVPTETPSITEDNSTVSTPKHKQNIIITIIFILVFISVCILVLKTFYYGKKVDEYDNLILKIEKKEETEAKIYTNKEIDNNTLRKVAATELINCLNSNIDINNLPDNIKNVVNEINNYYNESNNYFSFAYKDLFTGFTVSYNANQPIFAASSIKAPKDIYIYEMASQNKIDLEEKLTYTSNYYNTGSGVLKNKPVNTQYSVRTLLEYSTVTSDNAAHNMLMDKYGRTNILNFWKEKGTNTIFTQNNNWGPTSTHDAIIYMEELYKFYLENEKYGTELMNNFLKSYPKFIKGKNNENIASKSGWAGSSLHEMTIIFANNPYIVIALSNLGATDYYQSYFNKANDLAYKLHTEYWKYKINTCQNIKQY